MLISFWVLLIMAQLGNSWSTLLVLQNRISGDLSFNQCTQLGIQRSYEVLDMEERRLVLWDLLNLYIDGMSL